MQWNDLWTALALVMVIEGILPFISPKNFKKYLLSMQDLPETFLRRFGLIMMLTGLAILFFVRQ
jgi:uncharacterized protein YjeT (DUF2065 family)